MDEVVLTSRFSKPSKTRINVPSQHLYVAGIGHQLHTSKVEIKALFQIYGTLLYDEVSGYDGVELVQDKRYCYISYDDVSSAIKAVEAYHSHNKHHNLPKLLVQYAMIANPKHPAKTPPSTASTEHIIVPGLRVIENFISPELEVELLSMDMCSADSKRWEELLSRRIQHYGMIFNYRTLMLDYATPIPAIPTIICDKILPDINELAGSYYDDHKLPLELQQMTVNEYMPGQGISNHIDTDACLGPDLAILSLASDVVMTFQERRPQDPDLAAEVDYYPLPPVIARTVRPHKPSSSSSAKKQDDDDKISYDVVEDDDDDVEDDDDDDDVADIPSLSVTGAGSKGSKTYVNRKFVHLPRRSLLIMQGAARYQWSHGIVSRTYDIIDEGRIIHRERRVSLTFRQILIPGDIPSYRLTSSALEEDHVYKVYDSIAMHWNHTRGRRKVHWYRVKSFIESLSPGSLVADIGSGDGKYFNVNDNIHVIGCDRSIKLLEVSHEASHETFCCDAVKLPFRRNVFDATLCIAVFHHLASLDRRIALLRELLRITRVGCDIMIQAWAYEQDETSRWNFKAPPSSSSSPSCESFSQDVLVPWKLPSRFYMDDDTTSSSPPPISSSASSSSSSSSSSSHDDAQIYQRYCHVFREGELEDLSCSCPGAKIMEQGWDRGNWFIRLRKTADVDHHHHNLHHHDDDDDDNHKMLRKAGVGPTGIMPRAPTRL